MDEGNGMGYFSLANTKLKQADTTAYFTYFAKALDDKDLALEVKFQRLLPLLMGKDFATYKDTNVVAELFDRLTIVHKDDARSYVYYANYLQNRDKPAALVQYKKALSIDKSNPALWQDMFLLEIDLGLFEDLYTGTDEVLSIFPEEPLFNLFYALAAMQKEEYIHAKEKLQNGLEYAGDNLTLKGQMHAYLGDVEHSLGNSDESFKHYEKALEIDDNNVVVLNNYSYYLSVENKELEKAEKMISKCIELESGNATYLDTYAWVLFKRGRFFEAKYIIERAIDNGGVDSDVIVEHYGDILFMNNKVEDALIQWKKSLDMGNESVVLKRKIELKKYVAE